MMAARRYTREELINLRSSPLVQKPDNLPAIEQWIEYVYVYNDGAREKLRIPHSESQHQQQQNAGGARRQPQPKVGGDASPMGAFSTGVRPGLVTRTTGTKGGGEYTHSEGLLILASRLTRYLDDISLGPPRTMFPSSRNIPKVTDAGDKSNSGAGETNNGDEHDTLRSRFGERANRKSGTEKEGKDTRESWTAARERRALAGEDESRYDRYNRKDREYDSDRRNGQGDKADARWGERRPNAWRERQREKERGFDKGGVVEKDPEWMDDPAPMGAEDDLRTMGMPRNQEQFQKWKEAMSGKKAQAEEIEPSELESAIPTKETTPAKTVAPLKLEGIVDKPFGGWNDGKAAGTLSDNTAKPAPGKGRASRFASMFKDTTPKDEAPPVETPPVPATLGANGSAEDVAGFNRILQMLGGASIAQSPLAEVPTSPTRATSSGDKQKSRFTSFFDQTPKSPDGTQSPPAKPFGGSNGHNYQSNRGVMEDPGHVFGGMLPDNQHGEHARQGNLMSPQPPTNGNREQGGPPNRMNDVFLDQQQQQPPSRGAATPDVNIQNLLASQRAQKSQGQDKNSQFLLNLLQEKGTRPPSQQQRSEPFPLWLDQPPNMSAEPHAPKPRGAPPPPGFIDDQLLRNAPPDPPRQDQQPMAERRQSQRAPPGFFDDPNPFLQHQQQQRRTFTEPPQQHQPPGPGRRLSGHPTNMPPMPLPPHQQFGGGPPPDFMQGPPPGFNQQMPRHPPGFHNFSNVFQGPPPQGQQQRPDMAPGGGFPGMPGGPAPNMGSPPPNAPPGFYGAPPGMPGPPPGFLGMRSPNEGIQAGGMGMRDPGRGFEGGRFDGSAPRR